MATSTIKPMTSQLERGAYSSTTITWDAIADLPTGIYHINVSDTSVMPERWGALIVAFSGHHYKTYTFNSTTNKSYIRSYNISSQSWYGSGWEPLIKKVSDSISQDGVRARKTGNLVTLNVYPSAQTFSTAGAWNVLTTLPEGYRPVNTIHVAGYENSADSYANSRPVMLRVEANGDVSVYVFSDKTTMSPRGSMVYFTA